MLGGCEAGGCVAHPWERQHEVHREDTDCEQIEDPSEHRPGEADDPAEGPSDARGDFRDELLQPHGEMVVACGVSDPILPTFHVRDVGGHGIGELPYLPRHRWDEQNREEREE